MTDDKPDTGADAAAAASGRYDELSPPQRRAMPLASKALAAERAGDHQRAAQFMQRIADECGFEGVQRAMLALIDTMLDEQGHTREKTAGRPVRLLFQTADGDRRVTGADGVHRPEIVWAGRLVSARIADDYDTWSALIGALPEDSIQVGRHVLAVLEITAQAINQVLGNGTSRR